MEALIKPEAGLIFWTLFIFLILVIILSKTVWKPLINSIVKREEKIKNDIESAEKARQESEKIKQEIERRLGNLKEEINRHFEEAKRDAANEKEKIISNAHKQAELILQNAEKEIEMKKQEVMKELEKKILDISLLITKKVLSNAVDRKIDAQLSENIAKQLSETKISRMN
jgi:F-type H+-transporting ATPase subunit b